MTRLEAAFAHGPALVTFVTAGDGPTNAILDALVEAGADIVELGMPFTDPMADGPAIQAANRRSLSAGITTAAIFRTAAAFRARHPAVPLVLMGYANTMLARGAAWFVHACVTAGVDGVIAVDMPPEEDELAALLREAGVAPIRLATPTTDAARLRTIVLGAAGFIYHVAVAGVTGAASADARAVADAVARLKAATDLPVAVGFGVRTPAQAAAIAAHADAVVVGSAIVELVGDGAARKSNDVPGEVRAFVATLAAAVHGARNARRVVAA